MKQKTNRIIYFAEGLQTVTKEKVCASGPDGLGLDYAFDQGPDVLPGEGPEGSSGVFFSHPASNTRSLQTLIKQGVDWTPYDPSDADSRLWIGIPSGEQIPPQVCARDNQVTGHAVSMGDGQTWIIPIARFTTGPAAGTTPLNVRLQWDGETWQDGSMTPEHRKYFEQAVRFFNVFISRLEKIAEKNTNEDIQEDITLPEECDMVALGLRINYRISRPEISALGLFSTDTIMQAAMAAIDYVSIKKKY
jgi:hypothetical protein